MTINEKKYLRQLKGKEKWRNAQKYGSNKNGHGTLNYYTGVGKTYTAIIIIKDFLNKDNGRTIEVVVPTDALRNQWKEELTKFIPTSLLANITVNTAQKCITDKVRKNVDLLIVDEVHMFLGDDWFGIIDGTYYSWSYGLGLTATFDDKKDRIEKLNRFLPVIDTITEEEALREGYISNFIEFNLAIPLTQEEKKEYEAYSSMVSRHLSKFGKAGFDGANKVLRGDGKYKGFQFAVMWAKKMGWKPDFNPTDHNQAEVNRLWNPHVIIGYAKELMSAVRSRKDILYNAENKLLMSVQLIQKFNNLKTICFSQSTVFADRLKSEINKSFNEDICVSYHSRLSSMPLKDKDGNYITIKSGAKKGSIKLFGQKTLRENAIEAIRTGKARVISTASALDTGFDVEDIEFSITTSGTATPTQHKQRGGRVKRLKTYRPETVVLIVNLYVKGTKDEDWLIERQKKSNNKVHWIESISEIGFDKSFVSNAESL